MNIKQVNKLAKKYGHTKPIVDTVQEVKDFNGTLSYRPDIYEQAYACWESMRTVREEGERNNRYVYGNQWGDFTRYWDDDNQLWVSIKEEQALLRQGVIPITNNVILSIMNTFKGLFINNQTEPTAISRTRDKQSAGEIMSATLQYVYSLNSLWDLDRDKLAHYLIYGYIAGQGAYKFKDSRKNVLFSDIRYDRLILDNTIEDPRGWDCKVIGNIIDLSLTDILATFSNNNPVKAEKIKQAYRGAYTETTVNYDSRNDETNILDFNRTTGVFANMERVICVWRKECKERILVHDRWSGDEWRAELTAIPKIDRENERRKLSFIQEGIEEQDMANGLVEYEYIFDDYWAYYFLTPNGYVIDEGETPYNDNVCPIVFKADWGADGKIRPYVSNVIDQQKLINRNISVQDYINRVTAKGVTFYDDDALPDNITIQDIEKKMARPGATIPYSGKKGNAPHQITSNNTNSGAMDMVRMELDLLEKISGAGTAVQGQAPKSGTSGTLYEQQSQNSAGLLSAKLDEYRQYREERDRMLTKFILQFYDKRMYVPVHSSADLVEFDPDELKGVEFDVAIVESQSSPLFRAAANDMLMQFVQLGAITPKVALQLGSFTFGDKAIQLMEEEQKNKQEQQDPAMMQQMMMQQGGQPPMQ